jgi:hypothetical protein
MRPNMSVESTNNSFSVSARVPAGSSKTCTSLLLLGKTVAANTNFALPFAFSAPPAMLPASLSAAARCTPGAASAPDSESSPPLTRTCLDAQGRQP